MLSKDDFTEGSVIVWWFQGDLNISSCELYITKVLEGEQMFQGEFPSGSNTGWMFISKAITLCNKLSSQSESFDELYEAQQASNDS